MTGVVRQCPWVRLEPHSLDRYTDSSAVVPPLCVMGALGSYRERRLLPAGSNHTIPSQRSGSMAKDEITDQGQETRLMRRRVMSVVAAVLAAGVVLGSSGYASANERPGQDQHRGGMGSMMSEPEMRQHMKTCMSDMMSDPELRKQMGSMMSGAMNDMPMIG